MLLRFGAENFYCFKEGIEVSFELPANCPTEISHGKNIANLICVKGANASGKTNALKILSFLGFFCAHSFDLKPESKSNVSSFFRNDQPINLFCDFTVDEIVYRYELSLTENEVLTETVTRTKNRAVVIFKRERAQLSECIHEFSGLKKIKIRSNASLISTAHQYQFNPINPLYTFFASILTNVAWYGRDRLPLHYENMSKLYNNTPSLLQFTVDIIKKCDLGIKNVTIANRKDEQDKLIYFPVFEHNAETKDRFLTFYDQSSGTIELFLILPYYKMILETGGILVLDEFDINLHPHILPLLIGYFDNKETNPKNAQLIFTTHNSGIIDYMGKYRTVLIEKDKCESYAYRLDEIPGEIIRNDRRIIPLYDSGKIGGVPRL